MYNYRGAAEVVINFKCYILACIMAVRATFILLYRDPISNVALNEDFHPAHGTCKDVPWHVSQ